MCNRYNRISSPVHILVTRHLIPIHSSIELIHRYIFLYITYFWSYYGNHILSPYVISWIGFRPPRIEPFNELLIYGCHLILMYYDVILDM